MVFVNFLIHFRKRTRIRNPRITDPDPSKVQYRCGSGSTTQLAPVDINIDRNKLALRTGKPARFISGRTPILPVPNVNKGKVDNSRSRKVPVPLLLS
jgi:hypothetical protein